MLFSRLPILAPIAAAGLSPAALAQTPTFSLAWDAPTQCPSQAYVRSAVEPLVAGARSSAPHVDARARVGRCAGDSWCVRLTTVRDGTTAERVVQSTSCRSLAEATAVILAVTIDPERAPEPEKTGAAPGASDAPVSLTPRSRPVPATPSIELAPAKEMPAASKAEPPSSHVGILAQASSDLGALPQLAYGFTLGAALMLGDFRLEGYAARWAAPTASGDSLPTTGANVQLTVGGLRGCVVPWRSSLEISGCSGLELGDLHTAASPGTGPMIIGGTLLTAVAASATPVDRLWVSLTTSARAFWRLTPAFGLALDIGLALPLRRDALALGPQGTVGEPAWVAGRVSVGPEARF